ncbi:TPA: hypothetical protein DIC40_01370 [Patescibacteria group bacterium]|nr:hypothetical protein P148_SR1C00001G1082 [candidate division SR1 bacterium RAAC1_SR1_1]HCY20520.1 hypothetical protein [Candidatus Gracilibacteria bacterium]
MKKLLIIIYSVSCSFLGFAQQPDSTWVMKNLDINSVAAEYSPFPVDSMLLFTSKRRNNREDRLLEYTEKVYYTQMADTSFGKVKKLSYGSANIDANSALVGMSNKYWFFYRGYFNDQGKLFMAPRKQGISIESLQEVPYINSDYDENSIATKGDSLYFTSNRSGNYDIYFQTGKEKPVPVEILNSSFDENGVWITPNGKELYFNSNRDGWFCVYRSLFVDGEWQAPQKLPYPINISGCNTIDVRKQTDSLYYFASDRPGGSGGYDIYSLTKPVFIPKLDSIQLDSVPVLDTIPKSDSIPLDTLTRQVIPTPIDTITAREQLLIELEKLELVPFRGEIQLGAYQRYWTSVPLFKNRFKCIDNENIRMDVIEKEGESPLNKFVIDYVYAELDSALTKQAKIIKKGCLPEDERSMPFIALLRADKKRYAIFWKKNEYENKEVLWLKLDGQEIWRSK